MPFTAVIDADVLYQRMVRVPLLRAAQYGLYRPVWDEEILDEVRRTLRKNRPDITPDVVTQIVARIAQTPESALVQGHEGLIPAMKNHPKDRHVLAVAVHQHAQTIVTRNLRHFPPDACKPYNIEVQDPDEFMLHLWYLSSNLMTQVLQESAVNLVMPVQQFVSDLSSYAPTFSATLLEAGNFIPHEGSPRDR